MSCPLCNDSETTTSICAQCAMDCQMLGVANIPAPDATREQVLAWAKEEQISVFVCTMPVGG